MPVTCFCTAHVSTVLNVLEPLFSGAGPLKCYLSFIVLLQHFLEVMFELEGGVVKHSYKLDFIKSDLNYNSKGMLLYMAS